MTLEQNLDIDSPAFGGIRSVPDQAETVPAMVRFGAAAGNEISMMHALTMVGLWHERAAASVGTALTVGEVFELLLPLLTPDILELVLTAWHERQPALFSAYLGEAFTATRPSRTRTKKPRP